MWSSTPNLGDDIQALAQREFMEVHEPSKEIVYIERGRLDRHRGPPVKMLMSGWFTDDWRRFPPSSCISPVFVSFHANVVKRAPAPAHQAARDYFKAHEPIGCRDDATRDWMRERGVDAFTTRCMTLLLKPPPPDVKREGIYLVDVMDEELSRVRYIPDLPREQLDCIPKDILERGVRLTHELPSSTCKRVPVGRRLAKARDLLDKYRTAELVITTRLHCALPCRAFGTPVILLHRKYHTDKRFDGLHDILRGASGAFDFDELRAPLNVDAAKAFLREKLLERYAAAGEARG